MHTEPINHEPAITFIQTGLMIAGRPCIGSWIAYGLGSMNQDLPDVRGAERDRSNHPKANVQAISARLWSAGFLAGQYAGVALRAGASRFCSSTIPTACLPAVRRRMLDGAGRAEPAAASRRSAIRRP